MRARNNASGAGASEAERLAVAAEVLGHVADPTRLHLLRLLSTEQDVTSLTTQVAASRSSVSQHLGRLRLAGLVQARRDGRRMLYHLTSDHRADLVGHAVRGIPHHPHRITTDEDTGHSVG
ncbi:ArsR/SmtB family transcription factor [Amycolatopsis granulosa]|uniref:ArsR/SmtB family transcription factor n=1 Tax=Amycolatopsis granulosa TaxID=185684 RepID=UPI00141FA978|nr:metalloregulator ArsR/SmtB family transcription factor [Amycolatopsis granulosa]NIH83774.1 DNA-binding transcriptional ArsR family regulator [Amycolatopsis granulosa]